LKKITRLRWIDRLATLAKEALAGSSSLTVIVRNSGWLLLDRFLRLSLGVLMGAWVARFLGPAEFGELAYVLAYIAFFQSIAVLGLDGILVREIAQNTKGAQELLGTAFAMRLCMGSVCWLGAVGGMAWQNGIADRSVLLTALAGGSLVFQAADTIDLWFQSQSQSRRTVLAKSLAYLASNGIKALLILNDAPLAAFAAVMAFDGLAAAAGLALAYRLAPCEGRWASVAKTAQLLLSESWPFILSGFSIMVYMRIDQIMIKEMLGAEQLGVYTAVLPIATVWQFIPIILNSSLAPFLARKKEESEIVYLRVLGNIFKVYSLMAWLVCIVTVAFAEIVIDILYGAQYAQGAYILSIYVFANIFIYVGVAQGLWMLNDRRAIVGLFNTMVGASVSICGNLILIPQFGLMGAAVTSVVAMATSACLANFISSRKVFFMQMKSLLFR